MPKPPKMTPIEEAFSLREDDVREKIAILTPREKEVANLLGKDLKNTQIAELLGISPKTLDIHRAMLKRKLAVKTSGHLANYAMFWRYLKLTGGNGRVDGE